MKIDFEPPIRDIINDGNYFDEQIQTDKDIENTDIQYEPELQTFVLNVDSLTRNENIKLSEIKIEFEPPTEDVIDQCYFNEQIQDDKNTEITDIKYEPELQDFEIKKEADDCISRYVATEYCDVAGSDRNLKTYVLKLGHNFESKVRVSLEENESDDNDVGDNFYNSVEAVSSTDELVDRLENRKHDTRKRTRRKHRDSSDDKYLDDDDDDDEKGKRYRTQIRSDTSDTMRLQCAHCMGTFASRGSLSLHIKTIHMKQTLRKCNECDKEYTRSSLLFRHMATHSGVRPFECDHCKARFADKYILKRHIANKHFVTTKARYYRCDYCPARFIQKGNLIKHAKTRRANDRPFRCSVCAAVFCGYVMFRRHVGTHSTERKYRCDRCSSSFDQKSGLDIHTRLHTGERPFKCDYCPLTWSAKGNLNRHVKKKHTLNNVSPYV